MELRLRRGEDRFHLRWGQDGGRNVLHLRRGAEESHSFPVEVAAIGVGEFVLEGAGGPRRGYAVRDRERIWVQVDGDTFLLEVERGGGSRRGAAHPAAVSSPMPGQVRKVLVQVGEAVRRGQPLLVVEAMKMQIEIAAPHAGIVRTLPFAEGDKVDAGMELAEVEPGEDAG